MRVFSLCIGVLSRPLRRRLRWLCISLGLLFSGLAQASTIHPVRGFLPDLRFTLVGSDGAVVTQEDFRGKAVMLFFGYANCPDICPTTMAQLAQVMQALGTEAERARVLFISVDPHRDTPDILQAYVQAFDQRAVGLTGSARQIADVARRYRVSFQIDKPAPGADQNNYAVAHSRGIFFFDGAGRARFLASDAESVEDLAQTARTLLQP